MDLYESDISEYNIPIRIVFEKITIEESIWENVESDFFIVKNCQYVSRRLLVMNMSIWILYRRNLAWQIDRV